MFFLDRVYGSLNEETAFPGNEETPQLQLDEGALKVFI
jgi:hypothetical protein